MMKMEIIKADVEEKEKSKKQYRDTVIRTLFKDKSRAIELCNALTGSNYTDDIDIQLCDLDHSLLLRYNDLAFAIDGQLLFMVEHQTEISPNLPLRYLSYITDILFTWFVETEKLYGRTLRKIPAPKCYVLYNGDKPLKVETLKLSDAFHLNDGQTSLELEVTVIDVNYCDENEVLAKSTTLKGYSYLMDQIRINKSKGYSRDKAISLAIDFCIRENILSEFLNQNYKEVAKMLNWQYDQEAEFRVIRQEGHAEGHASGLEEGHASGLKEGHASGLKEGHASGLEEGHASGLEEGLQQKAIEIAKNGLTNNIPPETISIMTDLSISEIEEIKALL